MKILPFVYPNESLCFDDANMQSFEMFVEII